MIQTLFFVRRNCGSVARRLISSSTTGNINSEFCQENPYKKSHEKCTLCRHNVPLDYKNVQLLSQFISPYTGQVYDNKITGLCIPMHRHITQLIKTARDFGFMPWDVKEAVFLQDPKLFNPLRKK